MDTRTEDHPDACPYPAPPKPVDCTCEFPRLIARNGCGHTDPCPVYRRWKREVRLMRTSADPGLMCEVGT